MAGPISLLGVLMRPLVVPVMAGIFALWPAKLQKRQLLALAFLLWIAGGIALMTTGIGRLREVAMTMPMTEMGIGLAIATAIGIAKGRFVLRKTAARNIERLQAVTEALSPVMVYNVRSWILIELMMLLSAALTWFNAPIYVRGLVNVAVGLALVVSSLYYWAVLKSNSPSESTPPAAQA